MEKAAAVAAMANSNIENHLHCYNETELESLNKSRFGVSAAHTQHVQPVALFVCCFRDFFFFILSVFFSTTIFPRNIFCRCYTQSMYTQVNFVAQTLCCYVLFDVWLLFLFRMRSHELYGSFFKDETK